MNYRFEADDWGAQFNVPAAVLDNIKLTDGNYIKALLCILAGKRNTSTEVIADMCGISPSEADDAALFWRSQGIISWGEADSSVYAADNETKPLKFSDRNEPVSLVESVKPTKTPVEKKIVVNYTQREIREKAENDANLKQLVNDIQGILQFSINGKELGRLVELYEIYRFDVPTILLAAEYCNSIGKHSIAYLYAVMVRWFEENITTYPEVEQAIIRCNENRSFENKVLKIFGIDNKPSKNQSEYISKWNRLGFSIELIEIAYNKCMDSKCKLNFSYIDRILMSWSDSSITTAEQVRQSDEKFRSKFKDGSKASGEKETYYDLDEFENFALNYSLTGNSSGVKGGQ